MKAHFVKLESGASSLIAFERLENSFPFHWHYHPEFELTLIVEGQGQRLIGDSISDYGPGDLVLLGSNLPHSWRSRPARRGIRERHRAIVVQFRQDFLGPGFFALPEMAHIHDLLQRAHMGLAFGHTKSGQSVVSILSGLPTLSPPRRIAGLLDVLAMLSVETESKSLSASMLRPVCRVEERKRVDSICGYLGRHFDTLLDYKQLAQRTHMEQASLCRFFKRATGRTITSYLNEFRISEAARLLIETDQSLLEIGLRVGFINYSNYVRQFRGIRGMSPREFRKQFSKG
jgi:AraC-like DNA-binding protein